MPRQIHRIVQHTQYLDDRSSTRNLNPKDHEVTTFAPVACYVEGAQAGQDVVPAEGPKRLGPFSAQRLDGQAQSACVGLRLPGAELACRPAHDLSEVGFGR